MTAKERKGIRECMERLTFYQGLGIGVDGETLEELDEIHCAGKFADDDSAYDTCQTAWRMLEKLLKEDERHD